MSCDPFPVAGARGSQVASITVKPGRPTSSNSAPSAGPPPQVPDHELLRCIGQGSYGEVWLARNIMGVLRAVKVVYRASFADGRPYDREFAGIRKFEPVSRLQEGCVDILQIGRNDAEGYFYYVMEPADDAGVETDKGEKDEAETPLSTALSGTSASRPLDPDCYVPKTLSSELSRRGRLDAEECVKIGVSLSIALEHLHRHGLVHRDIKPSNVIYVNGTLKLADIGLVTETGEARSHVGTEGFMPPEGPGTPQADLYSLGKVLYELSSGKDRQEFPNPMTKLAEQPDREGLVELTEVIARACEGDPRKRYASATELRADLALLLGGRSVRRLRRIEQAWRRVRLLLPIAGVILTAAFVTRHQIFRFREAAQRRHVLLEQAFSIRIKQHQAGWFTNAWEKVKSAAAILPDSSVRDHAAATLIGLDARVTAERSMPSLHVAFDPTGDTLFVDTVTNGLCVWNTSANHLQSSAAPGHGPIGFLKNGTPVQLALRADGSFVLNDINTGATLGSFAPAGFTSADQPVLTPDATWAAAVFTDNRSHRIAVWHPSGEAVREFPVSATALALTPDGSLLAAGNEDGRIAIWSVASGERVAEFSANRSQIDCLRFHWERRTDVQGLTGRWLLAAGDNGGTAVVWDFGTQGWRSRLDGSHFSVKAAAFSPDGTTLATGGRKELRLWDIASGRLLLQIPGFEYTTDLVFSADGTQLAVSSRGTFGQPRTTVFNLVSNRGAQALRGLFGTVGKCCFSLNGRLIAALSHQWQLGIWDVRSGHLVQLFEVPKGVLADNSALAFNADGSQFAFSTGTEAGLWEVTSGRRLGRWKLPPGLVDLMAFRPDGLLMLCRMETQGAVVEPWGHHPRDHPRVCRIRQLSLPDQLSEITTVETFNWHVDDGFVTPDGNCFVIRGLRAQTNDNGWSIRAFDALSGKELWTKLITNKTTQGFLMDPQGKWFSATLGESLVRQWFELPSGKNMQAERALDAASLVSAAHWLRLVVPRGFTLLPRGGTNALVTLGIDFEGDTFPHFSSTSSHVAWGTVEGVLLVFEISAVRNKLGELYLPW